MNSKKIELLGVGEVTLVKRAQSRSLRLSVTASGRAGQLAAMDFF